MTPDPSHRVLVKHLSRAWKVETVLPPTLYPHMPVSVNPAKTHHIPFSLSERMALLMALAWSPVLGLSVVPAPQRQQLEYRFMVRALALAPVSLADAADAVRRLGVARVDGAIDPSLAVALKQRILNEMTRRSDHWVKPD